MQDNILLDNVNVEKEFTRGTRFMKSTSARHRRRQTKEILSKHRRKVEKEYEALYLKQ